MFTQRQNTRNFRAAPQFSPFRVFRKHCRREYLFFVVSVQVRRARPIATEKARPTQKWTLLCHVNIYMKCWPTVIYCGTSQHTSRSSWLLFLRGAQVLFFIFFCRVSASRVELHMRCCILVLAPDGGDERNVYAFNYATELCWRIFVNNL